MGAIEATSERFPGFSQIDPKGKASAYYVDLKSIKYETNGAISFKFVETMPDGSYIIQQGATGDGGRFATTEAVRYSSDGRVIGKTGGNLVTVSDDSQGLQTLLARVKGKADVTLKIAGLSSITDGSDFLKSAPIKDLIRKTMGEDGYKAFNDHGGDLGGDLKVAGPYRFVDTFVPHFATQKSFAYVDLASGQCVSGCIDDSEISIYGAASESELPDAVRAYFQEVKNDRAQGPLGDTINLHFLTPGEKVIQARVEQSQQAQTTAADVPPGDALTAVDSNGLINTMLQSMIAGDEEQMNAIQAKLQSAPAMSSGNSDEAGRLNKLGLAALKSKKYPDAAALFKSASEADPSDAKYSSNLAFAEMNAGDLASAEKHIYSSLIMAPGRAVAWDDLGLILAKKGDLDNAVAALMLANRASEDKGPNYLQDLQKDDNQNIRDAAAKALSKLKAAGRISDSGGQGTLTTTLPTKLNQYTMTKISKIGSRLEDMPGSGDAVTYENGGYQVSYDKIPGLDGARVGDTVKMQLIKLPRQADGSPCPPGDNRGSVYRVTDLRTQKAWECADSEHMCGGA
jgi:tetratricopeptide (TPR) repeat protein